MRLDPRRSVQFVFLVLVTILAVLILLPRTRAADRPAVGGSLRAASTAGHHGQFLEATWYSQPGTVGACGVVLGDPHQHAWHYVASPSLPCGTRLRVGYHGHHTWAVVQDRGPFGGADIDLSRRVFRLLSPLGAGRITVWVVRR
jgi:hypothetical protein